MVHPEKQLKYMCNHTLNTNNFSCKNNDVAFGLKSATLNSTFKYAFIHLSYIEQHTNNLHDSF